MKLAVVHIAVLSLFACAEGAAVGPDVQNNALPQADAGVDTTAATDGSGGMGGGAAGEMAHFNGVVCMMGLPEPCLCDDGQVGLQICEANADSPSGAAVAGCGMCGEALAGSMDGMMDGSAGSGAAGSGSAGSGSMDDGSMGTDPPPPPPGGNTGSCDVSTCPANPIPIIMPCCTAAGACGFPDLFGTCM